MTFFQTRTLALTALALAALAGCRDIPEGEAPTASITYTCEQFVCVFKGEGENGDVGGNLGFNWSFGDGSSGATGREVEHVFTRSGEYEVVLTVIDAEGKRGTDTITLDIESVKAAPYLTLVRDVLASYVYLAESVPVFESTVSQLQTDIETQTTPAILPATINCGVAGAAEINEWADDGNNVIDGGEQVSILFNNCDYGHGTLTSASAMSVEGNTSATPYELSNSNPEESLRIEPYPYRTIAGTLTRTAGATATSFRLTSDLLRIGRLNDISGRLRSEIQLKELDVDLESDNSALSGGFTFSGNEYQTIWTVETLSPLQFTGTDSLTLTGGELSMELKDTQVMTISVDADPAYIRIQINSDDDADFEVDERLPQALAVSRFSEY